MSQIISFTFARGGSKGLHRKALCMLNGRPLIWYSIDIAKRIPGIDRIIVSTDDLEIATAALEAGAEVPFIRPKELATDCAPEWLAWQHAIRSLRGLKGYRSFDTFVSLPVTSPLRCVEDVTCCLREFRENTCDVVVTASESERNPYFNMVSMDSVGLVSLVATPKTPFFRRQDAPKIFDVSTVCYVANPQFVVEHSGIWEGRVRAVIIPKERAVDIDTQLDLEWAEFLLQSTRGKDAHAATG